MTRLLAARRKLAESLPRDSQSNYHLHECSHLGVRLPSSKWNHHREGDSRYSS